MATIYAEGIATGQATSLGNVSPHLIIVMSRERTAAYLAGCRVPSVRPIGTRQRIGPMMYGPLGGV